MAYRIVLISNDEGSRDISHKESRALTVTADDVQHLHLVCNQFRLHFRRLGAFLVLVWIFFRCGFFFFFSILHIAPVAVYVPD